MFGNDVIPIYNALVTITLMDLHACLPWNLLTSSHVIVMFGGESPIEKPLNFEK
jgi:hypothetical protein